ncbi:DM13 domain-containing protein [Gordonia sputi]
MRIKTFVASAFAAFVVVGAIAGCSDQSTSATTTSAAPMSASAEMSMAPMSSTAAAHGAFAGLNDKKVSGTVAVASGKVDLAGFESDAGPDLHLYLAKGTSEADIDAGVELGKVAYDKASQSFTVPAGVDTADYTDVVVHCDKAKAVFGAAELMK